MRVAGLALAALLTLTPAAAYHIDNAKNPSDPNQDTSSADWFHPGAIPFVICESEFGAGVLTPVSGVAHAADDRNPSPFGNPGMGALCTTGENDATGVTPYPSTFGMLPSLPNVGTIIRLDVCDVITRLRNSNTWGPYNPANNCAAGIGSTQEHVFVAEIGAFSCRIPIAQAKNVLNTPSVLDHALYYDRLYAWWAFDPMPFPPNPGDPIGSAHSGTGGTGPNSNSDAFHGHVAVFIDSPRSSLSPPASLSGSVETSLPGPGPFSLGGGVPTNCGGSPGLDSFGMPQGPVFRAP